MFVTKAAENSQKSIAYIRVSSKRQVDEGVSMEAQKRRILEYARFKGLNLADDDIIIEEGVSGGIPIWERPRGRLLKQKLSTGQYANLISMKIDRMFRMTTDMLNTIDELADAGISIHIVDMNGEALDTSTSMGRFFLTVMGAMAEMERGLISERTQEGMNQLKATHQKFTQSLYGWNVKEDGSLYPNWNEQDVIDYMYWQIDVNGMSASAVARNLNKLNIKGKRGGKWYSSGLIRVKNNPFHIQRKKYPKPKNWGEKYWHR
jgi:DNA invertase Pin-like site-specific DNA recombinase